MKMLSTLWNCYELILVMHKFEPKSRQLKNTQNVNDFLKQKNIYIKYLLLSNHRCKNIFTTCF